MTNEEIMQDFFDTVDYVGERPDWRTMPELGIDEDDEPDELAALGGPGSGPRRSSTSMNFNEKGQLVISRPAGVTTSFAGPAITLYHGTASTMLDAVKKGGLIPGKGAGGDAWRLRSQKELVMDNRGNMSKKQYLAAVKDLQEISIGNRTASVYLSPYKAAAADYAKYATSMNLGSVPVVLEIRIPASATKGLKADEQESRGYRLEGKIPPEWIKSVSVAGGKFRALEDGEEPDDQVHYMVIMVQDEPEILGGPGSGPRKKESKFEPLPSGAFMVRGRIDLSKIENRRFQFDPKSNRLAIGGEIPLADNINFKSDADTAGSHAEDLDSMGITGRAQEPFTVHGQIEGNTIAVTGDYDAAMDSIGGVEYGIPESDALHSLYEKIMAIGGDDKTSVNLGEGAQLIKERMKHLEELVALGGPGSGPRAKQQKTSDGGHPSIKRFVLDKETGKLIEKSTMTHGDVSSSQAEIQDRLKKMGVLDANVDNTPNCLQAGKIAADVLETMNTQGYLMPKYVDVTQEKYNRETALPHADIARSPWTGDAMHVYIPNTIPQGVDLNQVAKVGFADTTAITSMREIVVHEMGHVQQPKDLSQTFSDTSAREAAGHVSSYAQTKPSEFIAESFVRLYRGETLHPDSQALYTTLKGPKIR